MSHSYVHHVTFFFLLICLMLYCMYVTVPGAKAVPPGPAHLDLIASFLGEENDHGWSKEGQKALVPLVFLALSLVPEIFLGKAG